MKNRKAATEWTVGKLVSLILVVILVVLIIWGFSTGAMTPLKNKVLGMYQSVSYYFGIGQSDAVKAGCIDKGEMIIGLGTPDEMKGTFWACQKYCKIDLYNEYSFGKSFSYYPPKNFIKNSGAEQKNINYYIFSNSPAETKFQWEMDNKALDLIENLLGNDFKDFYKSRFTKMIVLYGDGSGWTDKPVIAAWQNGEWKVFEVGTGKVFYQGNDDSKAITEFLSQVHDGYDDLVYYKIEDPTFYDEGGSLVGADNHGAPIQEKIGGDSEMDTAKEQEDLRNFLSRTEKELLTSAKISPEEADNLRGKLSSQKIELDGEYYSLGFDETNLVITITNSNSGYGLKFTSNPQLQSKIPLHVFRQVENTPIEYDTIAALRYSPFVLVKKSGQSWQEIGDERDYKLFKDGFDEAYKLNLIFQSIKEKC